MYLHWLSACLLSLWVSISWADEGAFHKDDDFNAGEYGIYPTHKFKTSTIEPPRINFMKEFSNCDDGSYIFVTPRGNVAYSSFYILDHECVAATYLPFYRTRLTYCAHTEVP